MTISADLSAALQTAISAVPNVGVVHPRPRFVVTTSEYLNLFKSTIGGHSVIRGWMLSRESTTADLGEFGEVESVHNYVLTGVAGFSDSDATSQYAAMQSLADTICATLDNQTQMGLAAVVDGGVGPCAIESYQEMQFGSVLCHVFVLTIPVRTFLPLGTA